MAFQRFETLLDALTAVYEELTTPSAPSPPMVMANPHEVKSINIPNPGQGNAFTFTIPAAVLWEVLTISLMFTASASASNRIVWVAVQDTGSNSVMTFPSSAVITANQTGPITWGQNLPQVSVVSGNNIFQTSGLPPILMSSTHLPTLISTNILASDVIASIFLTVREYSTFVSNVGGSAGVSPGYLGGSPTMPYSGGSAAPAESINGIPVVPPSGIVNGVFITGGRTTVTPSTQPTQQRNPY